MLLSHWKPPKDFPEFYARYPLFVRKFVQTKFRHSAKKANKARTTYDEMLADYEQDLLLFLATLPADSKYRRMGYTDRIQIFDGYGAKEFYCFVKMLLNRKIFTQRGQERLDPLFSYESRLQVNLTPPLDFQSHTMMVGLCEEYLRRNQVARDIPIFRRVVMGVDVPESDKARMKMHLKQIFAGEQIVPRRPYKKRTSKVLL